MNANGYSYVAVLTASLCLGAGAGLACSSRNGETVARVVTIEERS